MPIDASKPKEGKDDDIGVVRKAAIYLRLYDHWLLVFVAAGLLAALIYGGAAGTCRIACDPNGAAVQGRVMGGLLALLISLAALAIGAFTGFLFGLPRSLTDETENQRARALSAQAANDAQANEGTPAQADTQRVDGQLIVRPRGSTVNTNLEKISDWLTTIIVGVGLTSLPAAPNRLDSYGDNVEAFFGFGGKVFAIAGGIYFLIAGFFVFYVLTRVKLSLVFSFSDRENRDAGTTMVSYEKNVGIANEAPPVSTGMSGSATPAVAEEQSALKQADEQVLARSITDLKTPDEVIAWANAKARSGDYAAAMTAYQDVLRRVPPTAKLQSDYAAVLAGAGDLAGANSIVASLQVTTGASPEAQIEAQQKIQMATQTATAASLRDRLRKGLYQGAFEDSIEAGKELFASPDQERDAMSHVWLACAYGQKHKALKASAEDEAASDAELADLATKAEDEADKALTLQPDLKDLLRSLYDPTLQMGGDNDLQSLYPDSERLNILLDVQKPQA